MMPYFDTQFIPNVDGLQSVSEIIQTGGDEEAAVRILAHEKVPGAKGVERDTEALSRNRFLVKGARGKTLGWISAKECGPRGGPVPKPKVIPEGAKFRPGDEVVLFHRDEFVSLTDLRRVEAAVAGFATVEDVSEKAVATVTLDGERVRLWGWGGSQLGLSINPRATAPETGWSGPSKYVARKLPLTFGGMTFESKADFDALPQRLAEREARDEAARKAEAEEKRRLTFARRLAVRELNAAWFVRSARFEPGDGSVVYATVVKLEGRADTPVVVSLARESDGDGWMFAAARRAELGAPGEKFPVWKDSFGSVRSSDEVGAVLLVLGRVGVDILDSEPG